MTALFVVKCFTKFPIRHYNLACAYISTRMPQGCYIVHWVLPVAMSNRSFQQCQST
jgi:hypothetical protein